jgi:hypothetical protein
MNTVIKVLKPTWKKILLSIILFTIIFFSSKKTGLYPGIRSKTEIGFPLKFYVTDSGTVETMPFRTGSEQIYWHNLAADIIVVYICSSALAFGINKLLAKKQK